MSILPVAPAHRLAAQPETERWLIDQLWSEEAVGLIGGEPKCCKSFLALDLVVAVASGTPCLRRFAVPRPGRALLFAAEDALHVVRQRLDGIARAARVTLEGLDIQVITAPRLRLDLDEDARRLGDTVAALRPRLLVLDPFVRLHRRDENASGDVAPLLALLRDLQRQYQLAVVVVHHAKKGGGSVRAGQALRGSSEFHAWGDSMLYLRRQRERLTLSVEHRAAASIESVALELRQRGDALALEIVETASIADEAPPPPAERVVQVLADAGAPMNLEQLRVACRLRKSTLCEVLANLTRRGDVLKTGGGYALASAAESARFPKRDSLQHAGTGFGNQGSFR